MYADGGTLRTELRVDFVAGDGVGVEQTLVDAPAVSPLDEPVTIARQAKARVLLYVTSRASAGAALLTELATLRGYPVLQLRSVCNKRDRQLVLSSFVDRGVLAGVADELTRQVTLMNKQVVVLADVQDFYEHFGLRNALFVIGSMTAPSLLALPGPDGLSGKDIRDLCYEIQRVQPKYHAPSLYEPGIG